MITNIKNGVTLAVTYKNGATNYVPKIDGKVDYEEVKEAIAGGTEKYPTAIPVEPEFTEVELTQQAKDTNNINIISQIEALEKTLLRALREYALDNTNADALAKITQVETAIVVLRADLI